MIVLPFFEQNEIQACINLRLFNAAILIQACFVFYYKSINLLINFSINIIMTKKIEF